MWTTRDGYTLQLPHESLHTILSRLRPEQLRGITGGPLAGDPGPLLTRAVGRVAQAARRTPETLGGTLPVFSAPGFRLLVRPRGRTQGEILMVRPESEDSELIPPKMSGARRSWTEKGKRQNLRVRGARVKITWKAVPLADAGDVGGKKALQTVYILAKRTARQEEGVRSVQEKSGTYIRPLYVGETGVNDRMGSRLKVLREFAVDLTPYVVFVGTITPLPDQRIQTAQGLKAWKEAIDWTLIREDVEHLLVRMLTRDPKTAYRLTVLTPKDPVWIAEDKVVVKHVTPPPFLDPGGISVAPQPTPYEIAPLGWG